MSINTGISSCACKIFIFSVWNVLVSLLISILFSQAKVNDVHKIPFLPKTHQKVVWFDITMDEVLRVNIFQSANLENLNITSQMSKAPIATVDIINNFDNHKGIYLVSC